MNISPAYSFLAEGLQLSLQIENVITLHVTWTHASHWNSGMWQITDVDISKCFHIFFYGEIDNWVSPKLTLKLLSYLKNLTSILTLKNILSWTDGKASFKSIFA